MKSRNYSLIFITMLLANATTTAIAGTLIYGVLTGALPDQFAYVTSKRETIAAIPSDRLQDRFSTVQDNPGGEKPALAAVTEPDPGKVILFCRQIQEGYTGSSGMQTPSEGNRGDKLLPLVDKRNRIQRNERSEQIFF